MLIVAGMGLQQVIWVCDLRTSGGVPAGGQPSINILGSRQLRDLAKGVWGSSRFLRMSVGLAKIHDGFRGLCAPCGHAVRMAAEPSSVLALAWWLSAGLRGPPGPASGCKGATGVRQGPCPTHASFDIRFACM